MSARPGRTRTRGQALIEFALVLPVLTMMLFGLFDVGRAVYAYNTIANAARVGARVAIVNQTPTSTDPCAVTQSITGCAASAAVSLGINPGDVSISFISADGSTTCSPPAVGCLARVTVPYTFTPFTPVVGNLVGILHMSSTSIEPIESTYP